MDVTIIIVNYNTKELLKNCLNSIYAQTKDIQFEVIVSDNGSTDGSIEMVKMDFPQVVLIENNKNLGFGAANNQGLDIAKGKYVFYLNSDTILLNNAVKIFFDYWETSDKKESIGALGCNLLNENMDIIHSAGVFSYYRIALSQLVVSLAKNFLLSCLYLFRIKIQKTAKRHVTKTIIGSVDYVTGADLFMRNDNLARFDPYFFLYFEDSDLQEKVKAARLLRFLIEGPKIQHLCGGSVDGEFTIKRKATFSRIQFEISRVKYLRKYGENKFLLVVAKIIVTLLWINPFLFAKTKKYIKNVWEI